MLVHAHGHINRLRTILVADKNTVFSRIFCFDIVDSDSAALGLLSDDVLILANNLSVVSKPEDLWGWFTFDEARQAQRLRGQGGAHAVKGHIKY